VSGYVSVDIWVDVEDRYTYTATAKSAIVTRRRLDFRIGSRDAGALRELSDQLLMAAAALEKEQRS
jgi:hypothetical protein